MTQEITVALAGNPNSGKTTIFNALTGSRQKVGNYPGVTVEKVEGSYRDGDLSVRIVDLPGAYALSSVSPDELAARRFLLDEKPDLVVVVLDSSNLERNLYLATQLMEMKLPLLLVFNMADVARSRGVAFDTTHLSRLLGAPIVETVGHRGEGMNELRAVIREGVSSEMWPRPAVIHYGRDLDCEIEKLRSLVEKEAVARDYESRWIALKLLENDAEIRSRVPEETRLVAEKIRHHLKNVLGAEPEVLIADRRYGFISGACQEVARITAESRHEMSDKVDAILMNKVVGIPIFLGLMYLIFKLTFALGDPLMGMIESLFGGLSDLVLHVWPEGRFLFLQSLIVDGIIAGVGGVVVFLPNILLLFLGISVLEDTGYMARAAFLMDHWMHKIGLHGKSFIPMLIGFGCTVPAIMATRTLENRRDRMTTMMVAPLISCGARLPIYALIIPAFFPEQLSAGVMFAVYLIGILLAILCAKLLRSTLFAGETEHFVMELPPYRLPAFKGVLLHMWRRGWMYLRKAGTVILGASIVLWFITTFPQSPEVAGRYDQQIAESTAAYQTERQMLELSSTADALDRLSALEAEHNDQLLRLENTQRFEELRHTIAGRIGTAMEPVLRPMGFDWRIGTALIGAFAAKEIFVAQLGIVFSVGEADESSPTLREELQKSYSPLTGFCIMLFTLISIPCVATIAVTKQESNSWGWAFFQLGGLTALAFVVTTIVYQVGSLLGVGLG